MRRVLITGAGGFIGSHTCDLFVARGIAVHALFHYHATGTSSGLLPKDTLAAVTPFYGDIRDEQAVRRAMEGVDTVVHIAASISIPYSYEQPRSVIEDNVMGTLNVLLTSMKLGVRRVVVTSSSEVYGSADVLPILETHPLKPQSPYAASKVAADAISRSFYTSYELPVVILRPFNTFGPRQSDRAVIPAVIKQALASDHIKVGSTHTRRDYVYVGDTALAFFAAASVDRAIHGETIHIGTGTSYSIADMIEKVQQILGTNKPVITAFGRLRPTASEVTHLLADATKAKELLGWTPSVTFDQGLSQAVKYVRDHLDSYDVETYAR